MVLFPVKTAVEVWLGEWVHGVVVAHQHPAIWVQTEDGRSWFVTNRQRVRHKEPKKNDDA